MTSAILSGVRTVANPNVFIDILDNYFYFAYVRRVTSIRVRIFNRYIYRTHSDVYAIQTHVYRDDRLHVLHIAFANLVITQCQFPACYDGRK